MRKCGRCGDTYVYHEHIYTCIHGHVYIYIYVTYVYTVYVYVYIYIRKHLYMYEYIHVYAHVCVHTLTWRADVLNVLSGFLPAEALCKSSAVRLHRHRGAPPGGGPGHPQTSPRFRAVNLGFRLRKIGNASSSVPDRINGTSIKF